MIYLDFNRTTPLAPSVLEAMQPYWATHFMLPGQEHSQAQAVGESLEQARESVAAMVGCDPFEIVFTSGGTEANNLAICGQLNAAPASRSQAIRSALGSGDTVSGDRTGTGRIHVLVSELEHDSVLAAAFSLSGDQVDVELVPCQENGVVDPAQVESMLRPNTRLVCLQLANPVLGTLQRVREVADVCHNRGVSVHCDATQAFGKLPVDVSQLRADTVAVSGHKFYGPKGSGAVYVRRGLHLSPICHGEPREMGLRPGAENIPACIGLGAAAHLASRCESEVSDNFGELSDRFLNGLESSLGESPILLASGTPRIANTMAIEMPCDAGAIQKAARHLVFATAQSAQPPDEITRSLKAIGRTETQIRRTIRVSLGWTTSRDQIDRAVSLLADACDSVMTR
ncbi:aminotransferase class V [Rhodopirellula maiorica SM1]|uniref:Aminotransferase class V n=1 Tax=Rhodopirellula maiorica SM1 TaxID=1265738 RepID=M5RLL1_9BACT|nr:cysteine desulfurase family protein [Rhodopirellula maiorica]EMI20200.1 aminotransferase class V [Rhodopirellula maiorica SM1]